ncbi:MAG TPA: hypothetical protein VNY05_17985 [Candidatus Acidoferrales bacterium]|jgi:hypothetical protein|nr:hypothetical protein [Candidatus Acidoferrales bacterium]
MPITPIFSGQPFLPETLHNMSTAFDAACEKLGLVVKHDPATELVAKFMVELAQTGVHDYEPLLAATLERFGHSDCRTCQLASR